MIRHTSQIILLFGILFFLFLSLDSCNTNTIIYNDNVVFPDSNVSFNRHVYPFMKVTCSYQGCHSNETRAGGRAMTEYYTYFETYNLGLVIPYKPDNSLLIQFLERKIQHSSIVYFTVNQNQIRGMRKWIEEGARNN